MSDYRIVYRDELYHYGVKGMRWGVRRYQDESGRLTNAGKKRYQRDIKKNNNQDSESDKRKGLTDKQKKYIKIGAGVAATALATYGAYKLYKSGKLDNFILKGRNKIASDIGLDPENGLKLSKDKTLPDNWFDDSFLHNKSLEINNWDERNPGSMMNCGNCAIAFEAKMREFCYGFIKSELILSSKNNLFSEGRNST